MVTNFLLNTVLHHVGLSWIIETNQQWEYDIDEHSSNFLTNGHWYNIYISTKLYGTVFDIYIRNAITKSYISMCFIDARKKQQASCVNVGSSDGGKAIPPNSKTE